MSTTCISLISEKFNVIVLAGGLGTRLGTQSDFIPKALTKIGELRAIDFIIQRYMRVAHKFIIGCGIHGDLLESYVKGNYPNILFEFSHESELRNNAISTLYCLDHCDSRYGTIISFCDLLMIGNVVIHPDILYYTNSATRGHIGTFRHSIMIEDGRVAAITAQDPPSTTGVVGCFILRNTIELKRLAYTQGEALADLTTDLIAPYNEKHRLEAQPVESLYEFGTENDLQRVRELWRDNGR